MNLKQITPHRLRHTHTTILISKNVNVKVIAKRLGNTPAMILDIYGHTFKIESVEKFSESLSEVGKDSEKDLQPLQINLLQTFEFYSC
ncbi:tyrosine-type recombinase/integrase [Viridibacillus sp. YIM B01967]|uniref:Tyrosine-type recombinase/integrase n=1 Tax=Viridibacillus soli TaxID=2798301 RepID=A0ABS1H9E2_9BACL|nr:tyrosine-type recombinase/integrase [Viridibacillus soli]